ncbi:MAG: symmetrical bis(5'-nucleosyl)-tetraphosphatase [Burkholderiaceae bacterium]|jgi:bis(5'-nucleosyl)-tetraphosphatase (symmetrical)|nr:symmetrical bis(5'-nucleosyl)-tetraphosphatase [Burkholderiaceae bacterium]
MALYLIGDVQGCDAALGRLLDAIAFSPSRDRLALLGDLINRGPDSLAVLRRVMALQGAAACVLGNHDLHLLAAAQGIRKLHHGDTLDDILNAPDRAALLDWVRQRPLALYEADVLMVHAGVLPQWTLQQTLALAREVEDALRSPGWSAFLTVMYGNEPDHWDGALRGPDRLRVIVNALTRLRFCTPDGRMDFKAKGGADTAPPGLLPWFDVPLRQTRDVVIAFGHWSTLGWFNRADAIGLDTGCLWGGCLTAVRLGATPQERERFQIPCPQVQKPG